MTGFTYEAILTDIEGTTTPISFVKDVLFPYILDNLHDFLSHHWNEPELMLHLEELQKQSEQDMRDGVKGAILICKTSAGECINKIMEYAKWQMSIDRKSTALKGFQGFMWKFGFAEGKLKGFVYDAVVCALKTWKSRNLPVWIYSSGSVEAQKLLFCYNQAGDLLPFLNGHYDTRIGSKVESQSYVTIAKDIGYSAEKILFLSDNPKELEAAHEAGYQVKLAVRPGNGSVSDDKVPFAERITTFESLL